MSDFDKYFAERLEQEGQFPNREKNWKAMSKRLDAFDTGMRGYASHLRYWQTAAAISVVVMGLLFGKMHQMHRDIAKLQLMIASIQQDKNGQPLPDPLHKSLEKNAGWEAGFLQGQQAPGLKRHSFPQSSMQYLTVGAPLMFRQNSESGFTRFSSEKPDATAVAMPSPSNDLSETGTKDRKLTSVPLSPLPGTITTPERSQSVQISPKSASVVTPWIKPVRHNFSKYRLGVQTSLGLPMPRGQGISSLNGAGLTAEYTILPNLRLSGSIDWMRHEINSDTFMERQHFPHSHPKPKFGYRLSQVEGTQRSQYYSVGVSYTLPVRFAVRPVFRVAHTWVHWSSSLYNFEFEKKWVFSPPFVPKHDYEPGKSESEWLKNNWRFGAGLEYETQRWIAGVWADYSTNRSAKNPVFDILFLRAGVEYKFD
ncbi:MAG: hypothetical protein L6Q97_05965 [Thermoanaerobaculia bacterium]|nr:hypothetical protein [Thermoanaerobaculia bacterium]